MTLGREVKVGMDAYSRCDFCIKDVFNNSTYHWPASDTSVISQKHSFETFFKLFLPFHCNCADILGYTLQSMCNFADESLKCVQKFVDDRTSDIFVRDLRIVFFSFESNLESNRPSDSFSNRIGRLYHASRNRAWRTAGVAYTGL